jgi:hypothetical protein
MTQSQTSPTLVQAQRSLTLTLSRNEGTINRFYAFLDGKRVIASDGKSDATYNGEVMEPVVLKVRVWGIDDAEYTLGIDLPGTADDQELTLQLSEGYHELELSL